MGSYQIRLFWALGGCRRWLSIDRCISGNVARILRTNRESSADPAGKESRLTRWQCCARRHGACLHTGERSTCTSLRRIVGSEIRRLSTGDHAGCAKATGASTCSLRSRVGEGGLGNFDFTFTKSFTKFAIFSSKVRDTCQLQSSVMSAV